MHYFIEATKLTTQDSADAYGPVSNDLTNKFNITSKFQLSTSAKAFACQDSMMIVQQSADDPSLVNAILKPIEGLKIHFSSVKYFVYRGILKNGFISDNLVTPKAASNSEFIKRFWDEWENYKTQSNQPDLPDPTPQSFGYDSTLDDSLNLENIYDRSQTDVRSLFVKEGEWIGNFSSSHTGFEVVLETDSFAPDLAYLRANSYQVDVTGLSGLNLRAKREQILSFIDPAAFFGLHYDVGINISEDSGGKKTIVKKKENELYTLLEKFHSRNRVYIDIRSEKGYSYNFYQNYGDANGNLLKVKTDSTSDFVDNLYYTNSWPLFFDSNPMGTGSLNKIKLKLRIDDNIKPILFFQNTELLDKSNQSRFIEDNKLLDGTSTEWSKALGFQFPNTGTGTSKKNIPYYIKLHYLRQEYNAVSPETVLKNDSYFNTVFCPIDLPNLANIDYKLQHVSNPDPSFLSGYLPNVSKRFSYMAKTGCFWDKDKVAFYAQTMFQHENTQQFYRDVPIGIGASEVFNLEGFNFQGEFGKHTFLHQDLAIAFETRVQDLSGGTLENIKLIKINFYNGIPSAKEGILVLGITQAELIALKNITSLSHQHHRYLYLEEATGSPFTDTNGENYRKFSLKLQGWKSDGKAKIQAPPTEIFVYTLNGTVFTSKEFAAQEANRIDTYNRNDEEKVGYETREPDTNERYEDYFIGLDPGMKTEVDGFITALNGISDTDPTAKQQIKTLVEDSAKDIWLQAVNYVQTDLGTPQAHPDDRPLYWGRIKMEVTLKHIYSIRPNFDLNKMLDLFEERSRNYKGIDFSYADSNGLKKILITGFDPFGLNEREALKKEKVNIRQSNPSGAVALSLHNTTTDNNLGYIQTMIIPVRYTDFDGSSAFLWGQGEGIIEKYIQPWISEVDMIITFSQDLGPDNYNIDQYATATRGGSPDNLRHKRIPKSRSINILGHPELEWFKSTLPSQILGGQVKSNDSYVDKDEKKQSGTPPVDEQLIGGSGGNYLSNEIFYRVAKLRQEIRPFLDDEKKKPFPTGHFHIAKLQNPALKEDFSADKTKTLINIVKAAVDNAVTGI